MTEHETTPEAREGAERLDIEGPNESAPGHHPTGDEGGGDTGAEPGAGSAPGTTAAEKETDDPSQGPSGG